MPSVYADCVAVGKDFAKLEFVLICNMKTELYERRPIHSACPVLH